VGPPAIAAIALDRGADPAARDRTYRATAQDWAGHLGRPQLAALLATRRS